MLIDLDSLLKSIHIIENILEILDIPGNVEVDEDKQAVLMCSFKSTANFKITWNKGHEVLAENSRVQIVNTRFPPVRSHPPIVSNMFYICYI